MRMRMRRMRSGSHLHATTPPILLLFLLLIIITTHAQQPRGAEKASQSTNTSHIGKKEGLTCRDR
eukprot:303310-Rhodomonas_salina.2